MEIGYLWAVLGIAAATGCLWLIRGWLDKGQASLLYLPVVIACAVRFGFGPAVLGAVLSFLCWDFFFLPPYYTLVVRDPKDWLSLVVFLIAAVVTARLAAQARRQAQEANEHEAEIATLLAASESISQQVRADRVLAVLADQLKTLCNATRCVVFRRSPTDGSLVPLPAGSDTFSRTESERLQQLAEVAFEHNQAIGIRHQQHLWIKALEEAGTPLAKGEIPLLGAYVPLNTAEGRLGVLHIGPHEDGQPFSTLEQRLIQTLANHAAVALAREALAKQAAQAQALKEADLLKETLLSLVSHELRSPLAAIKATVTGLTPQVDKDQPETAEALASVDRQVDRVSAVVGNLLDLSRLTAGAWQPNKDWCDVADIIGTVLERLAPEQASRVQVKRDEGLPLVRADYVQIALVLANLLDNAVKYSEEGSAIDLTAKSWASKKGEAPGGIIVSVRDFGRGIAAGDEERIFTRFYRSARHQDSAIHGIGLGLALCQAIVLAHGGRIWAANAPSGEPSGAIFTISLPAS